MIAESGWIDLSGGVSINRGVQIYLWRVALQWIAPIVETYQLRENLAAGSPPKFDSLISPPIYLQPPQIHAQTQSSQI